MTDNQEHLDEEDRTACWMKYICALTDLSHFPTFSRHDRLPEEAVTALDGIMEDYRCNGPNVASMQMSMLIQAGVPDCWRGQLWQLFLASLTAGYNREIRSRRYKRLVALVSDTKSSTSLTESHHEAGQSANLSNMQAPVLLRDLEQVEKDLHRTWSPGTLTNSLANEATLRRVLLAYTQHNPEIGYCQGMNFLAGMLLLYLPEESTFWTLADIVEKYLVNYFSESMLGVVVDQLVCRQLLQQNFPLVTVHAEELQVDLALVATQWLLTAFVNVLSKEAVLRVWDIMLFTRSPCVLFRVLLMVFEMNVRALLNCKDSSELWTLVVKMPALCTDTSHLVDGAMLRFTEVTSELLQELRAKHMQAALDKSADSSNNACTLWLHRVPKHPNIRAEVDLECPEQDVDEAFFSPLSEQADSAAWAFCQLSRATRSTDSVDSAQEQRQVACEDAAAEPAVCDDEIADNSPMTLRRNQKNVISHLLPILPGTAEKKSTNDGLDSSLMAFGSVSGEAACDVLEKPTLATQLVLGCYVAAQKASGAKSLMRGMVMKGKIMQLHALERAVLSQQQQLMQMRAQKLRVQVATKNASKERSRKMAECALNLQAETRHHSDTDDLRKCVEMTKALFPSCLADLETADEAYEEENARVKEVDSLLQTLARSQLM